MAYLRGERQQTNLFPSSLEDYVGAEDPVRIYDAFVDQLDFKALGILLNEQQVGPPDKVRPRFGAARFLKYQHRILEVAHYLDARPASV